MSSVAAASGAAAPPIRARRAGFGSDLLSVAGRAVRGVAHDPESVIPALIVPVFFFFVNIGALQDFVDSNAPPGFDFKAFQLPVAIIFAVTGVSRASTLVTDIQDGYFDRLLITPVHRLAQHRDRQRVPEPAERVQQAHVARLVAVRHAQHEQPQRA